jgi:hypothetical protein
VPSQEIEIKALGRFYVNDTRLSLFELHQLILNSRNQEAIAELELAKTNASFGKTLLGVGIPVAAVSTATLVMSTWVSLLSTGDWTSSGTSRFQAVSGVLNVVGLASIIAGSALRFSSKDHLYRAITLYNTGLKKK